MFILRCGCLKDIYQKPFLYIMDVSKMSQEYLFVRYECRINTSQKNILHIMVYGYVLKNV